jgi:hypothetical protein
MTCLSRRGALVEEQDSTYMAHNNADHDDGRTRKPLQAPPPDTTHDEFISS